MSLFAKENLRTIGEGTISTGYVISGIGLIAPLIAITAAIIAVADNRTSNSRRNRSAGGQNNITIINFPGNQSPSTSLPNLSLPNFSFPNKNSSEDEINVYCNYCKFGNIVGILLAIALEVPWVALILGGLWLTGAGALLLGKSIIAYSESLPASRCNEPGNDAEHPLLAISMPHQASAPPMDSYTHENDAEVAPLAVSRPPSPSPPMNPFQHINEPENDARKAYFYDVPPPPSAPPLELSGRYPGFP